uniref:Uncharacterized protein n=1 Tax=Salmonella sp. TaxID=599 RepID=A0A482EVF2_SALSP|nr:hypothetical protein NNIBIDOC_00049 [Salmonella sp.]
MDIMQAVKKNQEGQAEVCRRKAWCWCRLLTQ